MANDDHYRGNLTNPLVKRAMGYQARVRLEQARARGEISGLITESQTTEGEVQLLTYLVGQTSNLDEDTRTHALAELDRLFNGEPDGRLPDQQRFQRPPDGEHPAIEVLQDLKDLVDKADPSVQAVITRIELALKHLGAEDETQVH